MEWWEFCQRCHQCTVFTCSSHTCPTTASQTSGRCTPGTWEANWQRGCSRNTSPLPSRAIAQVGTYETACASTVATVAARASVYQVTCRVCGELYIGGTHQLLKNRTNGHLNDTQMRANGRGNRCDTFASHFTRHLHVVHAEGTRFSASLARQLIEVKPIWRCSPIQLLKSFQTRSCHLCLEERIQIWKAQKKDAPVLMNSSIGVMGSCLHRPKIHRYQWSS